MTLTVSMRRACVNLLALGALATAAHAQNTYETALRNLKFRGIGPAVMGGRIDDFAVVESDPRTIYAGAAAGGMFKTVNGGVTWTPIFDEQANPSIGDIALAPSDPSILYVGTGEANNRQSSSWGNGVYKSLDAGKTWNNVGLKNTFAIGRVVVHPSDPNTVYVAAAGNLWGPNKERGIYKSTDGGVSWTQSLFISEDTGVTDIAIDPQSPNTLYAAAYQRRRTVFGYNGGGPESGLYRTVDGGVHWTKITAGLPTQGDVGRCAVDIYRKNPNIVYALVEHMTQGGIFRSEDRGATWARMSATNPRPSYYSQVRVDPNNDMKVWVLGAPLYLSEDGGRTFTEARGRGVHSDFHGFWIDPRDTDHVISGTDGGINISYDSGRTWNFLNTIPLGQFYEIAYDFQKPYHVCGGLQDNNTWCGPSATLDTSGIPNSDWIAISGGDGFYARIDPKDANVVYAESQDGNLSRRDLSNGQSKSIRPPEDDDRAPRYRFQWNSPLLISPHDNKTIYYGGNHLFKSTDRGDTWQRLGADLTTNADRQKMQILGRTIDKDTLSRHDGVVSWPCITSIAESPVKAGVLWAGTDDGNVQVTRDGGKTWTNVAARIPGVRAGAYVSRIEASWKEEGSAYVAFDNHRSADFTVYIYATKDFGATWTRITNGIPEEAGTVHVIREDPANPNLLFAGTEFGLFVSFNRGSSWTRMKNGLPTTPVFDLQIHPREHDLIVATHGRSIWIMDDISPLEQLDDTALSSDLKLFTSRPGVQWKMVNFTGSTGSQGFAGPNPPAGLILNYFAKARGPVTVTVKDPQGNTIRTINAQAEPGVNRTAWDMRNDPPIRPVAGAAAGGRGGAGGRSGAGGRGAAPAGTAEQAAPAASATQAPAAGGRGSGGGRGGAGGGRGAAPGTTTPGAAQAATQGGAPQEAQSETAGAGGGGRGGAGRGPSVDPGEFTVTIAQNGKSDSAKVTIEEDPRITISAADRARRRQAITRLVTMTKEAEEARRRIVAVQSALTTLTDGWKRPGTPATPDPIKKFGEDMLTRAKAVAGTFEPEPRPVAQLGAAGAPLSYTPPPVNQKISRLLSAIDGYLAAPTTRQLADLDQAAAQLQQGVTGVERVAEDVPKLNKMMAEAGVPYFTIQTAAPPPPAPGGRGGAE